jgi:hypothetical protein
MLISLALLLIAGPLVAVAWVAWWLMADLLTGPRGRLRHLQPLRPPADVAVRSGGNLRETP